MPWPADHPLRTDAGLAPHAAGAAQLCPGAVALRTLRHVAGRRVTTLVRLDGGDGGDGRDGLDGETAVLKVFANPRARGNHRRLCRLEAAGLGDIVPRSLGCDPSGHVGLVSYQEGEILDTLPDDAFVRAAGLGGVALRRLHHSGAMFDRTWTRDDELDLLRKRTPASMQHVLAGLDLAGDADLDGPLVSAHRDCHPRQLVATPTGSVAWIDLDDAAMAPAVLDVGNLVAHLTRESVLGRRSLAVTAEAQAAFLAGYRWPAERCPVLARWVQLSLLRLAGLAETRHQAPAERDALLIEAQSLRLLPVIGV